MVSRLVLLLWGVERLLVGCGCWVCTLLGSEISGPGHFFVCLGGGFVVCLSHDRLLLCGVVGGVGGVVV